MKGYIHSIESFGTVDGPGIRLVVFFQGCPMRCLYCHNPDTWEMNRGKETDTQEILELYEKNREFYKKGGITASGGEPLMQIEFLTELFEEAKKRNIHTCLDTSGIDFGENKRDLFDRLIKATDLVLLDIKHTDKEKHLKIAGQKQENVYNFAFYLEKNNIPVKIRQVVVPGLNDSEEEAEELGRFVGRLNNIKAVELLPYHTMGTGKYKSLGKAYPLEGTPEMEKEKLKPLYAAVKKGIDETRKNK